MPRNVPEFWIERLFERMTSLYGSRFVDQWRDGNLEDVKRVWREGLAIVTDEGLKRGVAALFHEKLPPTLPRFIELCRNEPMQNTSTQPALTGPRVVTPAAREALDRINEILKPVRERMIVKEKPAEVSEAVVLPKAVASPHIYAGYADEDELRDAELARSKHSRMPGEDDE